MKTKKEEVELLEEEPLADEGDAAEKIDVERFRAWEKTLQTLIKRRIAALKREADAKEAARLAKRAAERSEVEFKDILLAGPDEFVADKTPLLTLAENGNASWREFRIGDYFDLSAALLGKLGLDDDSTCGELSDLTVRVVQKNEKIEGVGLAAKESLIQAFDEFWDYPDVKKSLTPPEAVSTALQRESENPLQSDANEAALGRQATDGSGETRRARKREPGAPGGAEISQEEYEIATNAIIPHIDAFLEAGDVWEGFDAAFYRDVKAQIERENKLTRRQFDALKNIQSGFLSWEPGAEGVAEQ